MISRTLTFELVDLISLVPVELRCRSGAVFYSGKASFSRPSPVYLLGLNPGGLPGLQATETIGVDLEEWPRKPELWSAYCNASWNGRPPGQYGIQPRILHLMHKVSLDPRLVPSSNVVFVRSAGEADIALELPSLLAACWPFHAAVIERLSIGVIICLGGTAGAWVRRHLGADQWVESFTEDNKREWVSSTYRDGGGRQVVTLSHPGRVNWCNPKADPSSLVAQALDRASLRVCRDAG